MLFEDLGAEFIEESSERVVMRTKVVSSMLQPDGLLHGGMSAYLAETVGSYGSRIGEDPSQFQIMGLELTASHILPVKEGDTVESVATCLRRGAHIQVWDIKQYRMSDGELFNSSQLTTFSKKVK